MRNKFLALFALTFLLVMLLPLTAFAADDYQAKIEDGANLFTDSQETELMKQLEELTGYGNMGIATNESYNSDAASLARSKYIEMFGETNGTLFMIDMYNRRIQIFSGGSMYRTITRAKANEITDNIYTYATAGDYARAASKAFDQIKIILEGGRIVTPMKYATNAAFAVGLVLLINFIIITSQRKKGKAETAL
ncbi:MAG: TPM domain-containing protein, partial [Lachnospiraceae bacterium]|nr:TPM domain-containing protein [Lachnospiraceae bacterium]